MTNFDAYPRPHFVPSPVLAGREREVAPGGYRVVEGDADPVTLKAGQLEVVTKGGYKEVLYPGVTLRGWYDNGEGRRRYVVSFLYHKLDAHSQLETTERIIILNGFGYGVHPGHTGQEPSWYLIGPQVGTYDPQTGDVQGLPEPESTLQAKHFSIACITGGPLGDPVLANPQ